MWTSASRLVSGASNYCARSGVPAGCSCDASVASSSILHPSIHPSNPFGGLSVHHPLLHRLIVRSPVDSFINAHNSFGLYCRRATCARGSWRTCAVPMSGSPSGGWPTTSLPSRCVRPSSGGSMKMKPGLLICASAERQESVHVACARTCLDARMGECVPGVRACASARLVPSHVRAGAITFVPAPHSARPHGRVVGLEVYL
jgi:hypothetical protein